MQNIIDKTPTANPTAAAPSSDILDGKPTTSSLPTPCSPKRRAVRAQHKQPLPEDQPRSAKLNSYSTPIAEGIVAGRSKTKEAAGQQIAGRPMDKLKLSPVANDLVNRHERKKRLQKNALSEQPTPCNPTHATPPLNGGAPANPPVRNIIQIIDQAARDIMDRQNGTQVEIMYGPDAGWYTVDSTGQLFPPTTGDGYDALEKSIKINGQQEPIILDGTTLLDGRNRLKVLNALRLAPKTQQFAELDTKLDRSKWVLIRNLDRRHLTRDQQIMIRAKAHDMSKRKPPILGPKGAGQVSEPGDPRQTHTNQASDTGKSAPSEYPQEPAEITSKPKRGRPCGARSAAKALAAEAKTSRYDADFIVGLLEKEPELAEDIVQGRLTIKQARKKMNDQEAPIAAPPEAGTDDDNIEQAVRLAEKSLCKRQRTLYEKEWGAYWNQVVEMAKGHAEKYSKSKPPAGAKIEA